MRCNQKSVKRSRLRLAPDVSGEICIKEIITRCNQKSAYELCQGNNDISTSHPQVLPTFRAMFSHFLHLSCPPPDIAVLSHVTCLTLVMLTFVLAELMIAK